MSDVPDPGYRAFIEQVVTTGVVWGLSDADGWVVAPGAEDEQIDVMPFWASEDDASACATEDWAEMAPEALTLDDFLEQWLPGLEGDGLRVGVAWDAALEGVEVPPLELQADLEAAIADGTAEEGDAPAGE